MVNFTGRREFNPDSVPLQDQLQTLRLTYTQESLDDMTITLREMRREIDDRFFWERRRGVFGGTSIHVAVWALISVLGLIASFVLIIRFHLFWSVAINFVFLPLMYGFRNLTVYQRRDW